MDGRHDARVEVVPGHPVHDLERLGERVRRLVVARRGERVEDVGGRDDPRADEDLFGGKAARVPVPVHTLVVLSRHDRDVAHVPREFEVREELACLLRVGLHVRELGVVELPGLLEEAVAHRDLPVVVQQGRGPELLEIEPLQSHRLSNDLRVARDPLAVAGGLLVARVDRHGEGLDERLPEALLLGDELRVLDGDRGGRAEGGERFFVQLREGTAALVHDLEHADHLRVLPGHREREQALRVIARPLVAVGAPPRVRVRVGDVDRLARLRHRPGDADAHGDPDLADAPAECHARPELVLVAVDDEDRRAVRVEELRRGDRHLPQQRVEVRDRHELSGDVENEVEPVAHAHAAVRLPVLGTIASLRDAALVARRARPALGGPALCLAARAVPALGLPALFGHQPSSGMCSSTGPTLSAICSRSI